MKMTDNKNTQHTKEHMQRINYLYQGSNVILNYQKLSMSYCNLLLHIAKKTVQRLDITVKRELCKGCHNLLVCGVNARIRVNRKWLQMVCFQCRTRKKYNLKDYQLIWIENKEGIESRVK